MIRAVDLQWYQRTAGVELGAAISRVVERGQFILGEEVAAFERGWAAYVGARYCVAVGSGLDALRIALAAHGVRRGQEVIVPGHTFIATWLAVAHCGAIPVPCDADPATWNLDPSRLGELIGPRTAAIVPVHIYGSPYDSRAVAGVATEHGIPVIEDAAQAHGAMVGDRLIGGQGRTAAWSFYPTKNLGAIGDAGAVTTDDATVADVVRSVRDYGRLGDDGHAVLGLNSRMDEVQAAVLQVKLSHLSAWNERRRVVADAYTEAAGSIAMETQVHLAKAVPAHHQYVVRVRDRERFRQVLRERAIETLVHYPVPPHQQPAFAGLRAQSPLPVTEGLARTVVSLPIGPHLSDDQVDAVVAAMRTA